MCWSIDDNLNNENASSSSSRRRLIGYTRLLPPGVSYYEGFASIGRVVTHSSVRKTGLGKMLAVKSLDELVKRFGDEGKKVREREFSSFSPPDGERDTFSKFIEFDDI